ncbi:MAG TPA: hypothetical protein VM510_05570 [Caulifigura sp.]|jgi:hypothetical protein|nr:hypothetical protein [Caulifigura sp.]
MTTGLVVLTAVLAAAWVLEAILLVPSRGWQVTRVAGLAAGVCWASGVLALVSTGLLTRAKQPLTGVLSGVLFRTGGPLAALAVGTAVPALAQAGFPGQLVIYFLIMLVAETVLAIRLAGLSWKFLSRPDRSR